MLLCCSLSARVAESPSKVSERRRRGRDKARLREKFTNVRFVLGNTTDDPKLPANTLNAILMLDLYHAGWASQTRSALQRARSALPFHSCGLPIRFQRIPQIGQRLPNARSNRTVSGFCCTMTMP